MQTKAKIVGAILLTATCWIGAPCAAQVQAQKPSFPNLPAPRSLKPLPSKMVGVLVDDIEPVLAREKRKTLPGTVALGAGAGSYRWVYLPNQEKPRIGALLVPVGKDGKDKVRFNRLNLASMKALAPLGIDKPFTLVEIEVNGGRGGPAVETLVATRLRVVEGTAGYPLKVSTIVPQLRAHYRGWAAEQTSAAQAALARERQRLDWSPKRGTTTSKDELVFVTWLEGADRLHVQLRTRLQEVDPLPTETRAKRSHDNDDGEPPARPVARSVGVEFGLYYEISRQGDLLGKIELEPRPFHVERMLQELPVAAKKQPTNKFNVSLRDDYDTHAK